MTPKKSSFAAVLEELAVNIRMNSTKQGLINTWQKRGLIRDQKVLEAFRTIPREQFLPSGFESKAYRDEPLEIGYGQTISQPYTLLSMLELLNVEKTDKVLEIGAGSGYGRQF